jgi:hypothetical protein
MEFDLRNDATDKEAVFQLLRGDAVISIPLLQNIRQVTRA